MMEHEDISELFQLCDADRSGYIEREELQTILPHVDGTEIDQLLEELDVDGDGKISLAELEKGLLKITQQIMTPNNCVEHGNNRKQQKWKTLRRQLLRYNAIEEVDSSDDEGQSSGVSRSMSCGDLTKKAPFERTLSQFSTVDVETVSTQNLDTKDSTIQLFESLDSHMEAFQVYCHLKQEDEQLLKKFEQFVGETIQQIKEKSREKENLEKLLGQEKKKQQDRLAALEEETEIMSKKMEQRVIEKMQTKFDSDRAMLEDEIQILRENLDRAKQLEQDIRQEAESKLSPMREELTQMEKTLRTLKSEKMKAETDALLANNQLASYKESMEQHSAEREKEKEIVMDSVTEQINLARQVKDLQEANKHLQEKNADLHGEMVALKRKLTSKEHTYRNLSVQQELKNFVTSEPNSNMLDVITRAIPNTTAMSLSEELERASSLSSCDEAHRFHDLQDDLLISDVSPDDETDSPLHKLPKPPHKHSLHSCNDASVTEHEYIEQHTRPETPLSYVITHSTTSCPSLNLSDSLNSGQMRKITKDYNTPLMSASLKNDDFTPHRIYKVIFAGDAGVGKSSFILHVCKGVFPNNIASTLGIDFHTKNAEIDGTRIALQLWDTAGQERFRCISTSYFRKADGVVLLYDCCSERSFVSVRKWVSSIRDTAESEDIPIIICANKIDARQEKLTAGFKVITTEMGENLAKECNTMFCEISAKTGEKLISSMDMLSRVMKEREDEGLHNFEIGLHLHKDTNRLKPGCCS